ncbi:MULTISPECIES: dihydroorotase [Chryseobacterium]|uniref:Dihydroorotase n=1 Tax=Chryseobacterium camelliae TaxID=1265445 RepID=A0ABU0TNT3_9FLAO|nr:MULTISPECIES: dihydroorotase [Chryseobacterium]MDT3407439.1 dihydroorotase [Pseudacidovorax intermedius]MDQ1098710.1 dihydroorotase [Chryseobacterium camelliae]MDQ1102637.1 dihydroorotase [Chryseobacterium sp. SORGH_AS_1048]MDR6086066.1 dihydroorotase [Chryseobacterium sp. SORGH_AS_0909]MDR6130434.1 dihydroorotase [Chryseobacterium sp. SORGH_AS_1175]
MKTLIKNVQIVNEGKIFGSDILIDNDIISKIEQRIDDDVDLVIDGSGKYLLPGVIDDQVHFREPGLTHKGNIESESRSAIAGGVTSFIDQPNTVPNAVTQALLADKYNIASESAYANYGFMMGGTNDNLEEVLKTDPRNVPGIKLFLGSSTGNMLVDNPETLERIFSNTKMLIAVHCEDEATIKANTQKYMDEYGEDIPVKFHHLIRSEEACYKSSSKAIELAKKTGARLHVFHLSTARETALFRNDIPLKDKKITAEVCVHHLTFTNEDYETKGALIKWNPAVKTQKDKDGLWEALLDDRIDVIATDHAPHTWEEKRNVYTKCPSGAPLVQHSLPVMLENYKNGKISLEKIVEKMCHNPAILFRIAKRGFVREGYKADLVLVDLHDSWTVAKENLLYHCGWSPLEGMELQSKVTHTFVNGNLVYDQGKINEQKFGERLLFEV